MTGSSGGPALSDGEVHVWRIPLEVEGESSPRRARLLSPDERERMARFRFDVHRNRFALRRAALRVILGRYLGQDPATLAFRYSGRGKPDLEPRGTGGALRFNLSDSEDLAILAVTTAGEIGVDVERLRPMRDMDDLARRYFSPAEREEYGALGPERRAEGFYACWTRKEAWLKAKGEGLAVDLRSFDVTLSPGRDARLLAARIPGEDPARWTMHSWEPCEGFVAAIAVEARAPRFSYFDF